MKRALTLLAALTPAIGAFSANANLLSNGNLDVTQQVEIVPGFFLPKPDVWQNEGSRSISGPYEDEMSSEPWAGPAPTPVTADGVPDGIGNKDWGVFFKPFSGNATDGAATGHLFQNVPGAIPGVTYTLTGWAGAEPNALMQGAEIALEFLDAGGDVIGGSGQVIDLLPTLYVDNGLAFDYKQYTAVATAPANAAFIRARASMIGATGNPAGGGQAFVVDDFVLVPEPTSLAFLGFASVLLRRRSR